MPRNGHIISDCLGTSKDNHKLLVLRQRNSGEAARCSEKTHAVCACDRPGLPKGYQLSQYELALAINGGLEIDLPDGSTKRIGVRRAHLEEDTGKLTHIGNSSLIDFNRSGVALLEIVSEPDIRSPDEAEAY